MESIKLPDRFPEPIPELNESYQGIQIVVIKVLERFLNSVIISQVGAQQILQAIRQAGYVIVPCSPTNEMIEAAWADALAEDAAGVWASMIAAATPTIEA